MHSALRTGAVIAGCFFAATGAATAHPHAWLESGGRAHFSGTKLTQLDLHWRFDEVFSADILTFIKHDPSRPLAAADVAELNRKAFAGLEEYGYFTHLRAGDREIRGLRPAGFRAHMDGRRLVYDFSLIPAQPIDASGVPLVAAFYDPTYYVDIALVPPGGLAVEGNPRCTERAGPDTGHTIYSGLVTPRAATLSCAR
jgi:ABC-type uncharacterized transport system substrate-binding protein